jgi:hypothetical protein
MVVHREPARCDLGLAGHDGALRCGHEARARGEPRHAERVWRALVVHDHDERVPRAERRRRRDLELVSGPGERRGPAVDGDRVHVQPDQVEVEARQVLRRNGLDGGGAAELVRARRVAEVQVVVLHVVAAVAVGRVVGVADARRARRVAGPALGSEEGFGVGAICGRRRGDAGGRGTRERRHPQDQGKQRADRSHGLGFLVGANGGRADPMPTIGGRPENTQRSLGRDGPGFASSLRAQIRRRYRMIASGTKIARSTAIQMIASVSGSATALSPPSIRPRAASITDVTGLALTIA